MLTPTLAATSRVRKPSKPCSAISWYAARTSSARLSSGAARVLFARLLTHSGGVLRAFRREQVDHCVGIATFREDGDLPVGARPVAKDRVHVFDRVSRAELIH